VELAHRIGQIMLGERILHLHLQQKSWRAQSPAATSTRIATSGSSIGANIAAG
jgi:hypothetical protein